MKAHRGEIGARLGVCQWFHYEDEAGLRRAMDLLEELGVRHLRTGISWADFVRPGGQRWYDRQMAALGETGLEILLSVWHTPPSISEGGRCSAPPRRLRDYADFLDLVITRYGHAFSTLELWNEPNNRYKWDFAAFDPEWRKFAAMVIDAGYWCRARGVATCLGGISPADPHWVALMAERGVLEHVDVVAFHAFPCMWWPDAPCWDWSTHWQGWDHKVEMIREQSRGKAVWVTETGLATWELSMGAPARHEAQVEMLMAAAQAPAERIYWYSLVDLDPAREAIEGFHVDENEYHMGLVMHGGEKKPAYFAMKQLLSQSAARAGV
jgi:CDP-paratose 2-epimerase